MLKAGGTMITKTFTFTSPFSVWLLAVCAPLFDDFSVVKPRASRRTNSEVYCVGTGFRGSDAALRALRSAMHRMPAGGHRPSASIASAPVLPSPEHAPPAKGRTDTTTALAKMQKQAGEHKSSSSATASSACAKEWDLEGLPLAVLRRIFSASKYFHGGCQVDHLAALVGTFNFVKDSGHTPQWQQQIIQCIRNESAKGFPCTWEQWLKDNPITSISIDKTHTLLL